MIIHRRLGAFGDLSMETAELEGSVEAFTDALVKKVVSYGESGGFFIRPQSVRVRLHSLVEERMVRRYRATWYPDPREGVMFLEGPIDGETRAFDWADAPPEIVFPGAPSFAPLGEPASTPTVPIQNVRYVRVGIDPERDCWVYRYSG